MLGSFYFERAATELPDSGLELRNTMAKTGALTLSVRSFQCYSAMLFSTEFEYIAQPP